MSTTKRSRTTTKKKDSAPRSSASARSSAAAKAKRITRPASKAESASVKKARGKKAVAPREAPAQAAREAVPSPPSRAAAPAREAAPPPREAAPPPPPSSRQAASVLSPAQRAAVTGTYSLDGPVPPEGEGLAKKVGALLGIGQRTLGIKTFRPGQAKAFEHLLANDDLLAVMPTGSGKSLLYQLTSLVVPGVTVVVSPLIALIKDQLDKMVAKGISACKIDSTLTVKQRREVDELVRSPGGKLLLTTPERMADPEFRVFLREACGGVGVSRFVVDEAHCVSQWGHDFRPAYLSLRKALEDVGRPPVLATTATAPPHVRDDILFQLGIEGATTITTTFDRPNLHYEVIVFSDEEEKLKTLVTLLKKLPRPGIVYCATVKKVEELYEALTRWGIPVSRYHGRMTKRERDDSQQRFMESSELVMVATNAFGLGVDKPNIRNVLHYHVPGSVEAYAQEAGRGGRDGKPARCVLLFSPDDVAIQEYFLSGTYPTKRQVRQVFEALEAFTELHRGSNRLADETPPSVVNIALSSGVGQQRTRTVLSLLKDEHFVIEEEGGVYFVADPPPEPDVLADRARQYEARRIADRQRLDALLAYVKAPGCRNQAILEYLGEQDPPKCGRCDNCLRSREAALAASTEATRLGASLTQQLDEDSVEAKPRREIRARVVRIDQPPAAAPGTASAPATAAARADQAAKAAPPPPARSAPTVLRRSAAAPAAAASATGSGPTTVPASAAARSDAARPAAGTSNGHRQPSTTQGSLAFPEPRADAAPAAAEPRDAAVSTRPALPSRPQPQGDEVEGDEIEDDELDDDELEGDEEGDDEGDDDELAEGEDDELDEDDDDEDDDDEDDDGEDDDDEDDDEDDDDEDDDDYEVIDKTAAELAEEGVEGPGEITVLARKRVPKLPKQRPERVEDATSASAAEARRRRRRRRRKRRAMLPPKSAFTTPVLTTAAPPPESMSRRMSHNSGPVIEYVRGPMRIAMAPVASANPNDAGAGRQRRGGKLRRFERGGFRPDGPRGGPRGEMRADRFESRGPSARPDGPRPAQPWQGPGPGDGGNGAPGKRRRRRRRRRPGDGAPMQGKPGFDAAGNGGPPADAPVSFFAPAGGNHNPVVLGPDGQPMRKRRRRRRRGRGGRQREWRAQGQGGDGSGGAPPGGALSDGNGSG